MSNFRNNILSYLRVFTLETVILIKSNRRFDFVDSALTAHAIQTSKNLQENKINERRVRNTLTFKNHLIFKYYKFSITCVYMFFLYKYKIGFAPYGTTRGTVWPLLNPFEYDGNTKLKRHGLAYL